MNSAFYPKLPQVFAKTGTKLAPNFFAGVLPCPMADSFFPLWTPWKLIEHGDDVFLRDEKAGLDFAPDDQVREWGTASSMVRRMASGHFAGWLDEPMVRRFCIREDQHSRSS